MSDVRDPLAEASEAVSGRYRVRVLEPSPPAIDEGPFFADDPTRHEGPGDLPIVSPIGNGDLTWSEMAAGDEGLSKFAADRWLGAHKRLLPMPAGFNESLAAMHQLAQHVVAPARYLANGKIGLRYTQSGFGTPFFAVDRQVRMQGTKLILQSGDKALEAEITNLADLRQFLSVQEDLPFPGPARWDLERPLTLVDTHTDFLGDLFGFATSVLEEWRYQRTNEEPSRLQIWPEHFDAATDLGPSGQRANYGASPGDELHPLPYFYVGPWEHRSGSIWNEPSFGGASLSYSDLVAASDQRAAALEFFEKYRRAL